MKLSIIVPCYNCSKTIGRLLDSIVNNDLAKEEYEVIIVDDNSTDNFLGIVKTYEDKMNIVYVTTTRNFHCPGNTRQAGLPFIRGEWFAFIDNDDAFEPNIFKKVFQIIEEEKIEYVLSTSFVRYNWEQQAVVHDYISSFSTNTWLHGKFYNTQKVLNELKVHFKQDLFSHEDLYFNLSLRAILSGMNKTFVYHPELHTYKWIFRPDSLSYIKTGNLMYIEKYFKEYIFSTSAPYFEHINEVNIDWIREQLIATMLYGYLYYQCGIFRAKDIYPTDNLVTLKELKQRMNKELGLTDWDIINYVNAFPYLYREYKEGVYTAICPFVESQSFRDFILNL